MENTDIRDWIHFRINKRIYKVEVTRAGASLSPQGKIRFYAEIRVCDMPSNESTICIEKVFESERDLTKELKNEALMLLAAIKTYQLMKEGKI